MPKLTAREREHLAVSRVTALATDPTEAKLLARRRDVVTLLAVVDRLSEGPFVESLAVVKNASVGTFTAGAVRIYQRGWNLGPGSRRESRGRAS